MKNKFKALGIIALTAVIMFFMIACDNEKNVDNSKYYCDAPTGVVATKLSNESIHLTWNAVSGAGSYEISIRTNLDSADTRISIYETSNTSYEHSFYSWYLNHYLRPEEVTTLFYYVKAHPSKAGYVAGNWSNFVSVDVR